MIRKHVHLAEKSVAVFYSQKEKESDVFTGYHKIINDKDIMFDWR